MFPEKRQNSRADSIKDCPIGETAAAIQPGLLGRGGKLALADFGGERESGCETLDFSGTVCTDTQETVVGQTGEVGGHDAVGQRAQRIICQRRLIGIKNVESRIFEVAGFHMLIESLLVYNATASGIDEGSILFHQLQGFGVEHMVGGRDRWRMDRHHVRLG